MSRAKPLFNSVTVEPSTNNAKVSLDFLGPKTRTGATFNRPAGWSSQSFVTRTIGFGCLCADAPFSEFDPEPLLSGRCNRL